MIFQRLSSIGLRAVQILAASAAVASSAQQIVYDNTTTYLDRFAGEEGEFGDEIILGGTARLLTQIQFEYFGDFAQQGDELAKVRIYTNDKVYDLFRNEPTTVLFESGYFPINPGYNSRSIAVPGVLLPEVVTFTIEFRGLASTEKAGLLLYSPPTVGRSWNEFWRRSEEGNWQPIIYSRTDPTLKANAALRLTAREELRMHGQSMSEGRKFGFSIKGLNAGRYIVETSTDLVTWTEVESKSVVGQIASFERSADSTPSAFFRIREAQ
jgi:hypothetical protein